SAESGDSSAEDEPASSDEPAPSDEASPPGEPKDEPAAAPDGGEDAEAGTGSGAANGNGSGSGDGRVTFAFVGDILPAASVAARIDKLGVDYPFGGSSASIQAADIAAGNLETPISERGTPAKDKKYVYVGKPEYLKGVKNAGFDVLSLANNHTLDQGWDALSDTMDYLDDEGLQHMGSGADDKEAFTPAILEHDGTRVAFIGLSHVVPDVSWKADRNQPGVAEVYDTTRAVAAVKDAKALADIVVVMVHWGNELEQRPEDDQTRIGHTLIDAGADLVIGSHPHVLQGFEYYKNRWIAYSLGNFVFPTMGEESQKTGVLKASCEKGGACGLSFEPMLSKDARPAPMEPADGAALLAQLSELSYAAKVDEAGNIVPSTGSSSGSSTGSSSGSSTGSSSDSSVGVGKEQP
ncbi:CapA family protein, partial [Cohnella xylanilytica]